MFNKIKRYVTAACVALGLLAICVPPAYGEEITLTPDNTIVLRGTVSSSNMNKISVRILTAPVDTLYLFVDSPGGSIFAGLKLIDAIKSTDKNIVCIANTAISMAFVILQACDERVIVDNAVLMQHVPSYGVDGQEPNNYTFAGFIRSVSKGLYAMQAKRMGMTTSAFYAKIRDDWWMWDEEALTNRAADRKVSVKCSKELINKVSIEKEQVFIFTITMKFSGCPLIAGPLEDDSKNVPQATRLSAEFLSRYNKILQTYDAKSLSAKDINLINKP